MAERKFVHGEKREYTFDDLIEIVSELRGPDGCPWDRKQTHESLKECLVNECNEVLDAIDEKNEENMCEELGDVLLQVLMHAEIASESGSFSLSDVIQTVAEKMVRRHPHVFGDEKASDDEESLRIWKAVKKKEKEEKSKEKI